MGFFNGNNQAQNASQQKAQYLEKEQEQTRDCSQSKAASNVDFNFNFSSEPQADEELALRRERSQAYLDIISSIDMLSSTDEEIIAKLKEVVDEDIIAEYKDMSAEEMLEELRLSFEEEMEARKLQLQQLPEPVELFGVFSKCYITGCDIHAIDGRGDILQHYSIGRKYDKQVKIARKFYYANRGCRCIELYSNAVSVVNEDGSVDTTFLSEKDMIDIEEE